MKNKWNCLMVLAFLASNGLNAQTNEELIRNYLNNSSASRNVRSEDKKFVIKTEDFSGSMNSTMVQIQQTYGGIPVYNAYGNAIIKDKKVISLNSNSFAKSSRTSSDKAAADRVENIFAKVLKNSGIKSGIYDLTSRGKENSVYTEKVYYPLENELRLSYLYQFAEEGSSNYWSIVADAETGEILEKQNLTLSCDFGHPQSSEKKRIIGTENQKIEKTSSVLAADNAFYRIYALPLESPSFGERTLVTNPWDTTASPEGWHSDGTNHYTYTRGNNVYAYTDVTNNNTAATANAADGDTFRSFDFPIDLTQNYTAYKDAAVTNLFYTNNRVHDIMYKFGFNEAWRNFQETNFTTSGRGNDAVNAEARDASEAAKQELNNANFTTPAEGLAPRMQMYLWDPAEVFRLKYNLPTSFVSRNPNTKDAGFGPALTVPGVTGDLSATTPIDGCTSISEDLTGKIAFIQRGTCTFVTKVKNAQLKGAVAVIVYNAPTSTSFDKMGGTDSTITIPSILIDNNEGQAIANELSSSSTINVTLSDDKSKYIYADADLDNGIIVHEYGHGISNRLIGTTATCLDSDNSNEQMGEGWSDFFALMLTNKPGDNASVPRGIGTFVLNEPTTGQGIRLAKYSPDFAINNYTYGKTNGMTITNSSGATVVSAHSVGFVWATMLWDLHWKYVEKYGYSSDVTANPNSGSARVLQLVINALKLTACSPTFIDGRTAILQAEQNTTGGADKCMIWGVFAKRGLGVNAKAGLKKPVTTSDANVKAALNDQIEDFTYPTECATQLAVSDVALAKTVSVYPNPAKNEIFIKPNSTTTGKTLISIFDASGKLVFSERIDLNIQNSIDISKLSNGVYILKGEGIGATFSQKIIIQK